MDSKEILEITDESAVPDPQTNADCDDEAIGPLRSFPSPIEISQPRAVTTSRVSHLPAEV